jgi:CDP-glucose 4,6-dehydratase
MDLEVSLSPRFWSGRKVFLTGHTGFKGSWMLLMLRHLGAEVTGFSLAPPTSPSMFDLLGLGSSCNHIIGDIRDPHMIADAIARAKPDIVIHMAAQPLVRASYQFPLETYATNVMGTAHVLDACRAVDSIRAIVVVTTDKVYENQGKGLAFAETDTLGGHDPYSNSKACSELVVSAYRDSYFQAGRIGIASARAGNVIGGGDFAQDRIIPDAIRAFHTQQALMIRNPSARRPWQHVLEPLFGYLLLAEKLAHDLAFASSWNFGPAPEDARPVSHIVETMVDLWGPEASWNHDQSEQPHEAKVLMLDCSKAEKQLGYMPKWDLEIGLHRTMQWYKAWHSKADLKALSQSQINQFLLTQGL